MTHNTDQTYNSNDFIRQQSMIIFDQHQDSPSKKNQHLTHVISLPKIELKSKLQSPHHSNVQKQQRGSQLMTKHLQFSFSNMNEKLKTDAMTSEMNMSNIKRYTRDVQFETMQDGKKIPYIQYDSAATQVSILEEQSPLFQPFLSKEKQLKYFAKKAQQRKEIDQDIDLENIIQTDNEDLKAQYIEMVNEGKEEGHMMYLLSECSINADERFESFKFRVKQESKVKKLGKQQKAQIKMINSEFKEMDRRDLQQMKDKIKRTIERGERILQLKPKEFNIADLGRSRKYLTNEQKAQHYHEQGEQKKMLIMEIQSRKNEIFEKKINRYQQKQMESSLEYRQSEKEKSLKNSINVRSIRDVMVALNLERMIMMFRDTADKGLEQKRLLFKEHMKARVLQNAFRKHMIRNKITKMLTARQRTSLRNIILIFRIRYRIKRKVHAARVIELHVYRKELIKLFRSKLFIMNNSVRNIQILNKWYNKLHAVYMSQLNQKWDQFILSVANHQYQQQFKVQPQFAIDIKDPDLFKHREEKPEFQSANEKILARKEKLMEKFPNGVKPYDLLQENKFILKSKLKPQLMLHTYELKFSILRKIEQSSQRYQQEEDREKVEKSELRFFNDVLLPFSKHSPYIELTVQLKIKPDQQMHNQVLEKVEYEEIKLKQEVLRNLLRDMRKSFAFKIREYYENLLDYKNKNTKEVNSQRVKLMLKTRKEDLKLLTKQEREEITVLNQKRDYAKKKRDQSIKTQSSYDGGGDGEQKPSKFKHKNNIFAQFHDYKQDHLPFGSLTLKITENMLGNKPKFRVYINLEQFKKHFETYCVAFKTRYEHLINYARIQAQNQARLQKNKLKRNSVAQD